MATITFTGSAHNGTTISGGTPESSSGSVAALSGSEASSLDGGFYGPDAAGAGAAFVIEDSADGSVIALGVLMAE